MMSLFSAEIILDGAVSSSEARTNWKNAVESDAHKVKVKGKTLFLHSYKDNRCVLHYYQSYGRDFCDTMFIGEIFEYGEGGSQITGKITASTAMKRFAWIMIAASLPLAFLFNAVLYYSLIFLDKLNPYITTARDTGLYGIFTFAAAAITSVIIGIMCLIVDKRKLKAITDYLYNFLKESEYSTFVQKGQG
ncbi:MAG: hypothetical protein FWH07_05030 [Oscillospiraceae bacterium]|nr:hypothetical protein [Oscillospiraceae bacterium]